MKKIIYAAMFFLAITMMCENAGKAEAKSYKAGNFKYQYKNTKKGFGLPRLRRFLPRESVNLISLLR